MKSYAIDESSFKPGTKGRGPSPSGRGPAAPSSRANIPLQDIPEDMREVFKKYPTLPAVIKSNDPEVLEKVVGFLKTRDGFDAAADLSDLLVKNASTLSVPMAKVLLEQGATVGETHENMDAAFIAAEGKNGDLVMFFVEQGLVPPNHVRGQGVSLLMVALRQEDYALGDRLLAAGADINHATIPLVGQNTALHYAAVSGSFQSVIWLIERGADASRANLDNKWACQVVPEVDEESQMWDMDSMYQALKDYGYQCETAFADDPNAKVVYEIPVRLREMAYMESTPMSQMESMAEAMAQQARKAPEPELEGVLPKKGKKMGF